MLPRNRSVWFFPFFFCLRLKGCGRSTSGLSGGAAVGGWMAHFFLFLLRHHWPALYVRTISNGVSRYVHASVCESTRNEIQRHLGRALGHR